MINTTYNELKELCVEQEIVHLNKLAAFLDYPIQGLYKTVEAVSKGRKLFTEVRWELFKKSEWFANDYEFLPNERIEDMSHIAKNVFITDHGIALNKVTIKKYGKEFCKFVEMPKFEGYKGHCFVQKKDTKKQKHPIHMRVDRLVAEAFIGDVKGKIVYNSSDNIYDSYYKNLTIK